MIKLQDSLEKLAKDLQKKYGAGSFGKLSDKPSVSDIEVIPTGLLSLDMALGVGGIPRGRIIDLYGATSGGKSALASTILGNAQRLGAKCLYVDSEYTFDPVWAEKLGVDCGNIWFTQPRYGEEAIDILCDTILEDGSGIDLAVVDSASALQPKAEFDGEITDAGIGQQARLMSKAMRMLAGRVGRARAIVIFISQVRANLNITYGSQHNVTTGGKALGFYSSLRLDITRTGAVKKGEEIIGAATKIKVTKNKVAPPLKEAEVQLIYNMGFDSLEDISNLLISTKTIEKAGSWYRHNGEQLGQGKESIKEWLKTRNIEQEVKNIKEKLGITFAQTAKYGE